MRDDDYFHLLASELATVAAEARGSGQTVRVALVGQAALLPVSSISMGARLLRIESGVMTIHCRPDQLRSVVIGDPANADFDQ